MTKKKTELKFNMRGKTSAEMLLYGEIGGPFGIGATEVVAALKSVKNIDELNVRIHSEGGSVFDGAAIYNALKRFDGRVIVDIDGMALSIASYIALAGDTVRAADNSRYMIHNPWVVGAGESSNLRRMADLLDSMKNDLSKAYQAKTGRSSEDIGAMMDAETWMSAEEAREFGFVDEITNELPIAAKVSDELKGRFKHQSQIQMLVEAEWQTREAKAKQDDEAHASKMKALRERHTANTNFVRSKFKETK